MELFFSRCPERKKNKFAFRLSRRIFESPESQSGGIPWFLLLLFLVDIVRFLSALSWQIRHIWTNTKDERLKQRVGKKSKDCNKDEIHSNWIAVSLCVSISSWNGSALSFIPRLKISQSVSMWVTFSSYMASAFWPASYPPSVLIATRKKRAVFRMP